MSLQKLVHEETGKSSEDALYYDPPLTTAPERGQGERDRPIRWSEALDAKLVTLSHDKLEVSMSGSYVLLCCFNALVDENSLAAALRQSSTAPLEIKANRPVDLNSPWFYFEVDILECPEGPMQPLTG